MSGNMLRAKRWTIKSKAEHKTLINQSKTLSQDHSLYRICFWKTEADMLRYLKSQTCGALSYYIVQRVSADHPFLKTFNKESDDMLPTEAWLFWKTEQSDQTWSTDGISRDDIEVLDMDGQWRKFDHSNTVNIEEKMLNDAGFERHFYQDNIGHMADIYCAARIIKAPDDKESTLAILITQRLTDPRRVQSYDDVMNQVVSRFVDRMVNVNLGLVRLFIYQEAVQEPFNSSIVWIILEEKETRHLIPPTLTDRLMSKKRYSHTTSKLTVHHSLKYSYPRNSSVYKSLINAFKIPTIKSLAIEQAIQFGNKHADYGD
jgi:hypothetical protein